MAYVGPDDERSRALVARFSKVRVDKPLSPAARSAIALGCVPVVPKHFRIIQQFDGRVGAQYRNPQDPELRLDFLTSETRSGAPTFLENRNVALQPLKFMELSLERPVQACAFATQGACTVNVPAPERFAIHKLIVHGERPAAERTKAVKDLLQAASLISYSYAHGRSKTSTPHGDRRWAQVEAG